MVTRPLCHNRSFPSTARRTSPPPCGTFRTLHHTIIYDTHDNFRYNSSSWSAITPYANFAITHIINNHHTLGKRTNHIINYQTKQTPAQPSTNTTSRVYSAITHYINSYLALENYNNSRRQPLRPGKKYYNPSHNGHHFLVKPPQPTAPSSARVLLHKTRHNPSHQQSPSAKQTFPQPVTWDTTYWVNSAAP